MGNTGEQEKIIRKEPGKGLAKDIFFADGHYKNLRAMATTKEDVGLKDVPNNILAIVQALTERVEALEAEVFPGEPENES